MKAKIRETVKFILFIAAFAAAFFCVNRTLMAKGNYTKFMQFYDEKENFDVLFFGSSRMLDCVQPMELWEDYSITSYNMAMHSESLNVTYWQMKNAFEHNKPAVAVVDLSLYFTNIITDESDSDSKAYLHKSLDHMPLGKTKIRAVNALTEDYSDHDYLFPFEMYHNRWNELESSDFLVPHTAKKGAESRIAYEYLEKGDKSSNEISGFDVTSFYVDEIAQLCRENNVELVYIVLPSSIVEYDIMNAIEQYCSSNGISFYNINRDETVLNYHTDFADASHVNPGGGRKVTKLLGEYLTANYDFTPKSDKTTKAWKFAEYEYIEGAKKGDLINQEGALPEKVLPLLVAEDDFKIVITVKDEDDLVSGNYSEFFESIIYDDVIVDPSKENNVVEVFDKGSDQPFFSIEF